MFHEPPLQIAPELLPAPWYRSPFFLTSIVTGLVGGALAALFYWT